MTAKILQHNLSIEEQADSTVQQDMATFRETAEEHLGAKLTQAELEEVSIPMVMDGSKEQTLGKFLQKLVDDHCQLKQTEPYSPWQNAAEQEIKEIKKGSGHCTQTSLG